VRGGDKKPRGGATGANSALNCDEQVKTSRGKSEGIRKKKKREIGGIATGGGGRKKSDERINKEEERAKKLWLYHVPLRRLFLNFG